MVSVYVSEFISTTRSSFMVSSQPASARNKKLRRVGYDTCRIGIATITSFDKFNVCKYYDKEEDARICYIYAQ